MGLNIGTQRFLGRGTSDMFYFAVGIFSDSCIRPS